MLKGLRLKVKAEGTVECYPEYVGKRNSTIRDTNAKQTGKSAGEAVIHVLRALGKMSG